MQISKNYQNSNLVSLYSSLHNGLEIFEKYLINLLLNPTCPKKFLIFFIVVGGSRVSMTETLALSTYSLAETIPFVTIK